MSGLWVGGNLRKIGCQTNVFRKIGPCAQNMLPILEFDNQHEKRGEREGEGPVIGEIFGHNRLRS